MSEILIGLGIVAFAVVATCLIWTINWKRRKGLIEQRLKVTTRPA